MSRWDIPTETRIYRKNEKLRVMNVLLDMYEQYEYDDRDHEYIRGLKKRITKARAELRNMGCDLHA